MLCAILLILCRGDPKPEPEELSLSASASLVGEGSGVRYPRFKLFSFTAFRTSSNAT